MIPFGEWLPDVAAYGNKGTTEAKNVLPSVAGYGQLRALNPDSSALNSACRGAFAAQSSAKLSFNYAGSGSKLYQLSANTWTDQSKASGTYAVSDGDSWEFAKWGEKVIAVGGINSGTPVPPQIITMLGVGASEFADLGGSPPQARHIMVVKDFVVLGNIFESATIYPSRVRWSGINDETHWTTDALAMSDYQDIEGEGGWIRGMSGGAYGVIFQERAVTRMDMVGPPLVFSFSTELPGVGTRAPNSLVRDGDAVYFLENGGIKAVVNGVQIEHIGHNKVDNWIFSRLDESYMNAVVGALDRRNRRIFWVFAGTGNTSGLPNYGLVFDLKTGKFSRFEDEIEWVYDSYGQGLTLEELDAISTSIDALGTPLDSPEFIGGAINITGFDSNHKSGTFSGDPMTAVIQTTEQRARSASNTIINRVRPDVDNVGGSVTVAPGTRMALKDTVSWGAESAVERDGNHAVRVNSKFHRFRATITGGFEKALGVSIVESTGGSVY